MIIGFTGTQAGMEQAQRLAFQSVMLTLAVNGGVTEFHHGDCMGADAEAHSIVRGNLPHVEIHVHPPDKDSKRRFCEGDVMHEPAPYLDRNQHIVDAAEIVVATPKENDEQVRSGTWATVRRTRKAGKGLVIVYPDGTLEAVNHK